MTSPDDTAPAETELARRGRCEEVLPKVLPLVSHPAEVYGKVRARNA